MTAWHADRCDGAHLLDRPLAARIDAFSDFAPQMHKTRYLSIPGFGYFLVGAVGFELTTPCTPCKCATRLRYAPTRIKLYDENEPLSRHNGIFLHQDNKSRIDTSASRKASIVCSSKDCIAVKSGTPQDDPVATGRLAFNDRL